jgi:hypothetical protein
MTLHNRLTMHIRPIFLSVSAALVFIGCAHKDTYRWQYIFHEEEVVAWRESIVEAINCPDEWVRVDGRRLTDGPIQFDTSRINYNLQCPPRQVEAIVRTSAHVGWAWNLRFYVIRIRLDRVTALVLWMNEELEE